MQRKNISSLNKGQQPKLERHTEYLTLRDALLKNGNTDFPKSIEKVLHSRCISWLEGEIQSVRQQISYVSSAGAILETDKEKKREELNRLSSEIYWLQFEIEVADLRLEYCNSGKFTSDEDIVQEVIRRNKARSNNLK
jgi:hypothetical protein